MIFNKLSPLIKSTFILGLATMFSSAARFMLTVILAHYLSPEEFGVWATLTSVAAVIMFGDFGIGNALRNKLSQLAGKNGTDNSQREYFYTAFYVFVIFSTISITIIVSLSEYFPIEQLFNTENKELQKQGSNIFVFMLIMFLISLPFGIATGLFHSYGESLYVGIISVINSIITFIVVTILAFYVEEEIELIIKVQYAIMCVTSFITTLFFIQKRQWFYSYKIELRKISSRFMEVIKGGVIFMGNDITTSIILNSPTIMIAAMSDLKTAAVYNLIQKIFTFFGGVLQSAVNPIWGKLAELNAKGESQSAIVIANKTTIVTSCIFVLITIFLCIQIEFALNLIAGGGYDNFNNYLLVLAIGLTFVTYATYDTVSLVQKSFGALKFRLIVQLIVVALMTPAINTFYGTFGVISIPLVVSLLWTVLVFIMLIHRRYLVGTR